MLTAYVFKIQHPTFGVQYVARVYYNGGIMLEVTFGTVPTKRIIENRIGLALESIEYESGLIYD